MTYTRDKSTQANATLITSRTVSRIGFWSALLTTTWNIIFNVAIALGVTGVSTRLVAVGASLLLAFSFIDLMVSIHHYAYQKRRSGAKLGFRSPSSMQRC